mmetsp:Transcript_6177/g.17090  ORF Transcript_6177/g.17090 Transcript_6177/m.17090 type:complete len:214 (-) Transcript_6177:649-1290(-)|eukprot:CAMPEP_0115469620 /NCGR_PEP_ID=MMETSP0271-20121206/51573_1 /TAXON_ID=71861 /ORGANISM="Scrippsiella trochoidea, Strain CCMP3099" /LENGTH=213 /DNA_ID=CAMNT_0002896723 /DNA_START=437 /DNA_END=1078 /DNA_ORIENTATION=-
MSYHVYGALCQLPAILAIEKPTILAVDLEEDSAAHTHTLPDCQQCPQVGTFPQFCVIREGAACTESHTFAGGNSVKPLAVLNGNLRHAVPFVACPRLHIECPASWALQPQEARAIGAGSTFDNIDKFARRQPARELLTLVISRGSSESYTCRVENNVLPIPVLRRTQLKRSAGRPQEAQWLLIANVQWHRIVRSGTSSGNEAIVTTATLASGA